ncbi:MAG: radical SAM protein [Odoribacter splanchnicus]
MGCQLGCKFCATGTLGFKRNLTAGEIFEQVVRAQQAAEAQGKPLSNIVFMGMGEPLLNYEQVLRAIERITAQDGLAMSPYRITVSTAGIPEKIRQLADDGVRFNLALSLHAAKETTRTFLMPVNKAYPLSEIAGSLKYFVEKTGTRPTFEYLLLKDINEASKMQKLWPSIAANSRSRSISSNTTMWKVRVFTTVRTKTGMPSSGFWKDVTWWSMYAAAKEKTSTPPADSWRGNKKAICKIHKVSRTLRTLFYGHWSGAEHGIINRIKAYRLHSYDAFKNHV